MVWVITGLMLIIWLVLKFVLHWGGYVHMLLLLGISFLVIQIITYRKARYHRIASEADRSV